MIASNSFHRHYINITRDFVLCNFRRRRRINDEKLESKVTRSREEKGRRYSFEDPLSKIEEEEGRSRPLPGGSIFELNSPGREDCCCRREGWSEKDRDFNDPLRLRDVSPHPPFFFPREGGIPARVSNPVTQFAHNDVATWSVQARESSGFQLKIPARTLRVPSNASLSVKLFTAKKILRSWRNVITGPEISKS